MSALEQLDPLYHFNTRYPDRLSLSDALITARPERKTKSSISRRKNNQRYKTQPITFDEIKEVEEPATTPADENIQNSFLSKIQDEVKSDNRLQIPTHEVKIEVITVESPTLELYETMYPTKLSFLDVPENIHRKTSNKTTADSKTAKNRLSKRRNNPRYKTQPITFDEIKEVEEPEQNFSQPTEPILSSKTTNNTRTP